MVDVQGLNPKLERAVSAADEAMLQCERELAEMRERRRISREKLGIGSVSSSHALHSGLLALAAELAAARSEIGLSIISAESEQPLGLPDVKVQDIDPNAEPGVCVDVGKPSEPLTLPVKAREVKRVDIEQIDTPAESVKAKEVKRVDVEQIDTPTESVKTDQRVNSTEPQSSNSSISPHSAVNPFHGPLADALEEARKAAQSVGSKKQEVTHSLPTAVAASYHSVEEELARKKEKLQELKARDEEARTKERLQEIKVKEEEARKKERLQELKAKAFAQSPTSRDIPHLAQTTPIAQSTPIAQTPTSRNSPQLLEPTPKSLNAAFAQEVRTEDVSIWTKDSLQASSLSTKKTGPRPGGRREDDRQSAYPAPQVPIPGPSFAATLGRTGASASGDKAMSPNNDNLLLSNRTVDTPSSAFSRSSPKETDGLPGAMTPTSASSMGRSSGAPSTEEKIQSSENAASYFMLPPQSLRKLTPPPSTTSNPSSTPTTPASGVQSTASVRRTNSMNSDQVSSSRTSINVDVVSMGFRSPAKSSAANEAGDGSCEPKIYSSMKPHCGSELGAVEVPGVGLVAGAPSVARLLLQKAGTSIYQKARAGTPGLRVVQAKAAPVQALSPINKR